LKNPVRLFLSLLLLGMSSLVAHAELTITVQATNHPLHNAPVTVALKAAKGRNANSPAEEHLFLEPEDEQATIPCQGWTEGGMTHLTFIVADLAKGAIKVYRQVVGPALPAPALVQIRPHGHDQECLID